MPAIRIIHLVLNLKMGGLETWVVHFAKKIKDNQFSPMVCCLESNTDLGASLKDHDIPVVTLDKREGYDFFLPGRLAKMMRDYQSPLLHTHNWDAHLYGTVAARIASVPVIIHTQHGAFHHRSWKNDLLRPILGRCIDRFIGVSDGVSLFAKQSRWAPEEKVMTIINGVDPTPYRSPLEADRIRIRASLSIPLDAPIIINVARMNEVKDHDTLLKAFCILKATIPSAHLMLVGDGNLCPLLKGTAVRMGIEKFVHFIGIRTDVPDLLRAADLFVLSSLSEGISLSLLEAMSAGLPVAATDVGGNPSVVVANKTGLLVPPRNPAQMASVIQMILDDKALSKTMGEAGYGRVLSHFSFNQMADAYMGLYRELLIKKRCRGNG